MRRQRKPRTTWLGRLIRGRRPDRNPLRRGSDKTETLVLSILMAVFLAGSPFVARATSDWAYARSLRTEQVQQATVRQVPAVILQVAPVGEWLGSGRVADARWTAPDGRARAGQVPVPFGTRAGDTVTVWTTLDGTLTGQPMQRYQVSNTAVMTSIAAVSGLAVTLLIIGWVARWVLDRRRLAEWEADWLAHGPRWTSRR